MTLRRCLVALAWAAIPTTTACDFTPSPNDATPLWTSGQAERRVRAVDLDTLFHRDGRTDSTLLLPSLLRRAGPGLAVLDRFDETISLYARDGRRLWTTGGRGEGPGEFGSVRDMRDAGDGALVVYDSDNGKVARVDLASGAVDSEVRLPEEAGVAESMVPLGRSIVLVTFRPTDPLVRFSLVDGSVETLDMPWAGFRDLHALHRQGITAIEGSRWAYLFRMGNGFFAFDGMEPLDYLGQFAEHTPFPALSVSVSRNRRVTGFAEQPVCTACSASIVRDTLFVHFGGGRELSGRVVDAYAFETGEYLLSLSLPAAFKHVEVGPDWIAAVREDPYPELMLLSR